MKRVKNILLSVMMILVFPCNEALAKTKQLMLVSFEANGNEIIQKYAPEIQESLLLSINETVSNVQFPHSFSIFASNQAYYKEKVDKIVNNQTLPYSKETLKKLADKFQLQRIYYGTIGYIDQQLSITLSEYEVASDQLKNFQTVKGKLSELFSMNNQLATQIMEQHTPKLNEAMIKELRKHTDLTQNMEAFELYIKGKALYREERFEEAYTVLSQALQLDPNFIYAYFYRGQTMEYSGKPVKANEDFKVMCDKGYRSGCNWLYR